jgi:hypothetical protein
VNSSGNHPIEKESLRVKESSLRRVGLPQDLGAKMTAEEGRQITRFFPRERGNS